MGLILIGQPDHERQSFIETLKDCIVDPADDLFAF